MITEIYIENIKVDATSDIDALLSFAVDDVKEFSSRNTSYSKTIVLPGTDTNNKAFGNIFSISQAGYYDATQDNISLNYNSAKSAHCIIFQGNVQVFKGVIRMMEIIIDNGRIEYECSVFGELSGLVGKMAALKLDDLDFSTYNHTYNLANIRTSWDNASGGSGYFYPVADYGNYGYTSANVLGGKHNWSYKTLRPALFVKQYIDKIFAAAGFSYDCALFNTTRFKSLIIPHNQKVLSTLSTLQLKLAGKVATYTGASKWDWTGITLGSFTGDAPGETWTYNGTPSITVNINVLLTGQVISQTSAGAFLFELVKNGTVVLGSVSVTTTSSLPFTFSSKTIAVTNITLVHGDSLIVRYPVGTITSLRQIIGTFQMDTVTPTLVPLNINDTITINDSIPKNILQKDFITSVMKMFNLYITEDKGFSNYLKIAPYVDYFDLTLANAKEWTYMLDVSKPISIKPMAELTSRYYEFKYKDDTDFYNDAYKKKYNLSYGSYLFDTEFEFANDKSTADVIFSGTPLVGYTSPVEDKIYSTILKQSGTSTIIEEPIDSNIRIWQAKKILGVTTWSILDAPTVLGSQTYYGYAGHLGFDSSGTVTDDLNFGMPGELYFTPYPGAYNKNQFNVYWLPYMYEIIDQDSRLFTATFRLDEQDINQLDFSKLIYIEGVLFRLNKIIDYNATKRDTCKVELLKVINTSY